MAVLKFKPMHGSCGGPKGKQAYLEYKTPERALARDTINIPQEEVEAWGDHMDDVRHCCGNDLPWKGRSAVMYREAYISPDPRDNIDLRALRQMSVEWAERWFGEDGEMGAYNVAIVYHDDNLNHILHAHVVINNTNLETGKRLHISNKQCAEMWDDMQKMCEKRGLHSFIAGDPTKDHKRAKDFLPLRAKRERVELKIILRGSFSWKEDLRRMVEVAVRVSRSVPEFCEELAYYGIGVTIKEGDFVFAHPSDPNRLCCYGATLGDSFTKGSIQNYLQAQAAGFVEGAPLKYPVSAKEQIRKIIQSSRPYLVARTVPNAKVGQVLMALIIQDEYGICCMEDYDATISRLQAALPRYQGMRSYAEKEREIASLIKARAFVSDCGMFAGVKPADVPGYVMDESGRYYRKSLHEAEVPTIQEGSGGRDQHEEERHRAHGAIVDRGQTNRNKAKER